MSNTSVAMLVLAATLWATSACRAYRIPYSQKYVTYHQDHNLYQQLRKWSYRFLINQTSKDSWNIYYGFADTPACAAAEKSRQTVEAAIRRALEMWLQPVKDMQNKLVAMLKEQHPQFAHRDVRIKIVDNINIVEKKPEKLVYKGKVRQVNGGDVYTNYRERQDAQVTITFYCRVGRSFMWPVMNDIHMYYKPGTPSKLLIPDTNYSMRTLVHEIGHTFGLLDTYVESTGKGRRAHLESTGGSRRTIGRQEESIMGGGGYYVFDKDKIRLQPASYETLALTADDRYGIKHLYMLTDFFKHSPTSRPVCTPEMEQEMLDDSLVGCRPRYPLIFSLKYANLSSFSMLIKTNRDSIDINARDKDGNTALHYAVATTVKDVVRVLWEIYNETIDTSIANNAGKTAHDIAQECCPDIAKYLRGK